MALKVLIADKEKGWRENLTKEFTGNGFVVDDYTNGKTLQLKLAEEKIFSVIMNLDLEVYNGIQLLKYIRLSCPQTKVVIVSEDKNSLSDFNLTDELVRKMGAIAHIQKPIKPSIVVKLVDDYVDFSKHTKQLISDVAPPDLNAPVAISDDKFTRIKLDELFTGSHLIFDIYVRLGPNKFLKLFNQGEFFEEGRLKKYVEEKNNFLYFQSGDRRRYMQFMNDLASKVIIKTNVDTEVKVNLVKGVVEKYVEEAYIVGLKPSLLEYSSSICDNIFLMVKNTPDLYMVLRDFEMADETEYSHSFVSAFFSVMVLKQFNWQTSKAIETMVLASLFHDIGLVKIPEGLRRMPEYTMTPSQKEIYHTHCQLGVNMLPQNPLINAGIKQIVFQHHEVSDGSGYPSNLSDHQIFPMAKILSLVNFFSESMIQKKLKPLEALRFILSDPNVRIRYNQEVLVGLAKIFINPKD